MTDDSGHHDSDQFSSPRDGSPGQCDDELARNCACAFRPNVSSRCLFHHHLKSLTASSVSQLCIKCWSILACSQFTRFYFAAFSLAPETGRRANGPQAATWVCRWWRRISRAPAVVHRRFPRYRERCGRADYRAARRIPSVDRRFDQSAARTPDAVPELALT